MAGAGMRRLGQAPGFDALLAAAFPALVLAACDEKNSMSIPDAAPSVLDAAPPSVRVRPDAGCTPIEADSNYFCWEVEGALRNGFPILSDIGLSRRARFPDQDKDGFGDCSKPVRACLAPAGYLDDPGDCDDANPDVHAGATERWADGIDSDCDGHENPWRCEDGPHPPALDVDPTCTDRPDLVIAHSYHCRHCATTGEEYPFYVQLANVGGTRIEGDVTIALTERDGLVTADSPFGVRTVTAALDPREVSSAFEFVGSPYLRPYRLYESLVVDHDADWAECDEDNNRSQPSLSPSFHCSL